MNPFDRFTSKVLCLPQKDIDTDQIIPADFLKTTSCDGLGQHVFSNLKKQDPAFPKFEGQRILVTGKNFGCGSSREHAPWALKDAGIDVVISSNFADIFRGNAEKNGLLLITFPDEIVRSFLSQIELTIDLEEQIVVDAVGIEYKFEISGFTKKKLLGSLLDLDYLLGFVPEIQKFTKNQ